MSLSFDAGIIPEIESRYLAHVGENSSCLVNLSGCYDYLESAYYISQDLENSGQAVFPGCKDMLDAYIPPIFLHKARLAGLEVPEFYISNGYFEPPVIIDPINPFMIKSRTVWKDTRRTSIAKSMTRNYTYAICCQELNPDCRIVYFRSVLGWCTSKRFRESSRSIWEVYHIPLGRVRMIIQPDGEYLFSDLSPLPLESLTIQEKRYLKSRVKWVE